MPTLGLCETATVSAPSEVPPLVAKTLDLSRKQGFITSTRNETGRLLAALAQKKGISMTAVLEVLIRKEAKEEDIT